MRNVAPCIVAILIAAITVPIAAQQRDGRNERNERGEDEGRNERDERRGRRGRRGREGRGGFDATSVVERLDRNGNQRLDPDEVTGRARFFLQRFAPDADLSRPIPLDEVKQLIQRQTGNSSDSRDPRGSDTNPNPNDVPPLVPGFGEPPDSTLTVPGFGTLGDYFHVPITPEDTVEVEEAFRRYDRDRNELLDRREMRRGNWFDDPTAYDQNRDGQLSKSELAVRYARRRIGETEKQRNRERREREEQHRSEAAKRTTNDGETADNRNSYRFTPAHDRLPSGIPDWFKEKDVDLDGQVAMWEFLSEADPKLAEKFTRLDWNGDGLLSPQEAIDNGERPARPADANATGGGTGASNRPESSSGEIPDRYLKYATSLVQKYDSDGDGKLSKDEVAKMRRQPTDADRNGDGKISPEEYALHLMKR